LVTLPSVFLKRINRSSLNCSSFFLKSFLSSGSGQASICPSTFTIAASILSRSLDISPNRKGVRVRLALLAARGAETVGEGSCLRLLMQPAQLGGIPFAVSANMSLICDLSEVLIDSLLLSWVKVEDVGRLDSAMCNKFQRPVFLSLINRDKFVLDHSSVRQDRGEPVDSRVDQFISWILARHVAVAELSVSTSLVHDTDKN
jgi:hypothetical protein